MLHWLQAYTLFYNMALEPIYILSNPSYIIDVFCPILIVYFQEVRSSRDREMSKCIPGCHGT